MNDLCFLGWRRKGRLLIHIIVSSFPLSHLGHVLNCLLTIKMFMSSMTLHQMGRHFSNSESWLFRTFKDSIAISSSFDLNIMHFVSPLFYITHFRAHILIYFMRLWPVGEARNFLWRKKCWYFAPLETNLRFLGLIRKNSRFFAFSRKNLCFVARPIPTWKNLRCFYSLIFIIF